MAETRRWEYYVETLGSTLKSLKDEELGGLLKELGEAGWEVFSIENSHGSNKVRVAAKRPVGTTNQKPRGWP